MAEIEKRKMERFDLELKTYLSVANDRKKQKSFELLTSNICAGGAFFKINKPISVETDVNLEVVLPMDKLKDMKNKFSHIDVSGSVIRADQQGMAICFDKKYKILSY